MKRHLIIGHYGTRDRASIRIGTDEALTRLNLVSSNGMLNHGAGDALVELGKMGIFPSEIGIDLLTIAMHVHAADTHISRETESQDSWTREIRLVVPVSDPATWMNALSTLTRMLNFLTGDLWVINFRPRPSGFAKVLSTHPQRLIDLPFDVLSLFSGGLDSLIGAIDLLENGNTPLLISHAGEGATSGAQQECFDNLKRAYLRNRFDRLRIWTNFHGFRVNGVEVEKTTRGRSFLFFAIGVFAGTGLGRKITLRVPENGLIALNIPLDQLRLGSHSTRTTHPFYIARWNELLNILQINVHIEDPFWNQTKGEMVAGCRNQTLLRQLIPISMSCSSPTKGRWKGIGVQHCGYCLPCLIRRAALESGLGHGLDPTDYGLQFDKRVISTLKSEGQQIRSFQFAIRRLQSDPRLAKIFIHNAGPLFDESLSRRHELAEVYRRGMEEVARLLQGVRTQPTL